jgi:uncharacterized membrane protein
MSTHLPVVGTLFGFCLYLFGWLRKNEDLKDLSLVIFILSLLLTVPAYLSGAAVAEAMMRMPNVTPELIEQHKELAQLAFGAIGLLALLSLAGLIVFRKPRVYPCWFSLCVMVLTLAAGGLMGWTANKGAQVRHPEIRSPNDAGPQR